MPTASPGKSCTRTRSGSPVGCHSRPPFWKSPDAEQTVTCLLHHDAPWGRDGSTSLRALWVRSENLFWRCAQQLDEPVTPSRRRCSGSCCEGYPCGRLVCRLRMALSLRSRQNVERGASATARRSVPSRARYAMPVPSGAERHPRLIATATSEIAHTTSHLSGRLLSRFGLGFRRRTKPPSLTRRVSSTCEVVKWTDACQTQDELTWVSPRLDDSSRRLTASLY